VPSKEESKEESKPAETGVDNENEKGPKARASKLEFKMVNETYVSPKAGSACKLMLICLQLKQIGIQVYNSGILGVPN
jgi:hypothetical protein